MRVWNPQANAMFLQAHERSSPELRKAFLDEACANDPGLRDEVEQLLRAHDGSGSFLERPLLGTAPTEDLPSETDSADPPCARAPDCGDVPPGVLEPCDAPGRIGKIGPYEVIEIIGAGGMGLVLRAHDPKLNRTVALKVLAPEFAANAAARKRFLREAQAAAAVTHPHIITIYAVDQTKNTPYLVMECVDAPSLAEKIDRRGCLEVKQIVRIGAQIAAGLAAAHAHGLVHRDIKPSNILLEGGMERVRITDFGLARAVDDVEVTRSGEVIGTPPFMSPEQAQGEAIDYRSDLFSLGAVLYTMCTGRSPFHAETTVAVLRRVCDDVPRPIREVNPDIPEPLEAIIDRLLAKDADERLQTAQDVSDLLLRYLDHLQDPAVAPPPVAASIPPAVDQKSPDADPSPCARSRRRALAVAAAALLALGIPLAVTEATGVTHLATAVVRIATGAGTLVVEVDDPQVSIAVDGEEVIITGAGPKEVRLKPGPHRVRATKNGQIAKQELVTIKRGGRHIVNVALESPRIAAAAAKLSADYASAPEGAIIQAGRLKSEVDVEYWVCDLEFSPSGTQLLCGRATHVVEVWSLDSGERLCVEPLGSELAVSPRGDVVASDDGSVRMSSLHNFAQTREFVERVAVDDQRIHQLAVSPDSRHVASAGPDQLARIWDMETGRVTRSFHNDRPCWIVQFSPNGRSVLVGNYTLWLYDLESGAQLWRVSLGGFSAAAAFSPCGRWVVAATQGQLVLRDARTGEEERRFRGHTAIVWTVRFLPDGRHLISGSEDHTMRLWNVETGREIARVTMRNYSTNYVAVSPDGRSAASGGGLYAKNTRDGDYDIRLWRLPESVWAKSLNNVSRKSDSSSRKTKAGR